MRALFFDRFDQLRWLWKAGIVLFGAIFFNVAATLLFLTSATNVIATQRATQLEAFSEANLLATQMEIQTLLAILTMAVMLGLVVWLVRVVERRALLWSRLGLPPLRRHRRAIFTGAGIGLVVGLACCVGGLAAGTLHLHGPGSRFFSIAEILNTFLYAAALAAATAVAEEVVFRGYLQNRLAARTHPVFALIVVSGLFAIAHPWQGGEDALLALARAGLMGLLLGLLYMKTGNCWTGISAYGMWTFLNTAIIGMHAPADEHFFGAPLLLLEHVPGTSEVLLDVLVIGAAALLLVFVPRVVRLNLRTAV